MPLLENLPLAADAHFRRTAERLLDEATPKPPPEPLLQRPQSLARIAPQPDRLAAVTAARSPLLEAARPLLVALARLPAELKSADQEAFHRELSREITAFQSIAQDARVHDDEVLMASYLLCAALDEAVAHAPWARANESTELAWKGRLCMAMHRASNGGEGFFLLLGGVTCALPRCLDLLELMLLLLALGFEGMYRKRHKNGPKVLRDIRNQTFSMVHSGRQAEGSARWRAIERLVRWQSLDEVLAEISLEDLFS